jgi:hypothetical protein
MRVVCPLTDLKVRNLKAKETRYKVFDGVGLYIEILPTGNKSWRLKHY